MPPRTKLDPPAMRRSFSAHLDNVPKEAPAFDIDGEEFHCSPAIAPATLMRVLTASYTDPRTGRPAWNTPDVIRFIEECLIEETVLEVPGDPTDNDPDPEPKIVTEPADDIARWQTLMDDRSRPVPIEELGSIMAWLIEVYTARPTTPSGS